MSGRNPFVSNQSGAFLLDYRRDMEYSQRMPISPQTIAPLQNPPSLNAFSQLKQTKLHSSKLDYLLEPQDEFGPNSRVITMFSGVHGSIHAHDEAASVLQRYSPNQIAFIGIWGSQESDKGFFYDRIIELCDVKEPKYSKAAERADEAALIYFYERPFIKNNIRIFLLDCKGYEDPDALTREEKAQLDIMMGLCEIIILTESTPHMEANVRPKDIVQTGYQHFNECFKRLYIDRHMKDLEVSEISWPINLMVLFDSPKSIKAHQNPSAYEEQLEKMFQDYNFSVLHNKNRVSERQMKSYTTINNPLDELYSKNTSTIFKDMYEKIHRKAYLGMKFTGFTCPHILTHLSNAANKNPATSFPRAYEKAKASVYASLYNRQAIAYLIKLKQYIHDERTQSTDNLLAAFAQCREETFKEYDDCHTEISVGDKNNELYQSYEEKLDEYLDEKQKNIINVNFKKSMKQLSSSRVPIIEEKNADVYKEFQKLVSNQVQDRNHCDANADTYTAGNVLKTLFRIKIEPTQDLENLVILEKKTIIFRKQQEKQTVLKTKIMQLQDHKQAQEKEKVALKNKSKYFSEVIKKTQLSIDNLKKELNNSVHSEDKKERDLKIAEAQEELASLRLRYNNKLKSLNVERRDLAIKTEKESKLERRLQETISNIKQVQGSIIDPKYTKTNNFAQIRRIEDNTRIRRSYRHC